MRRTAHAAAGIALVGAMAFGAGTQNADAAAGSPIRNNNSNLCLGIDASANAVQWTCNGNPDQQWTWGGDATSDFVTLKNGNGKCLGVDSSSTTQGARLRGWTCNGNWDQYWLKEPRSGGFDIENFNDGMVVAVYGGTTTNGQPVVQWTWQGHADQLWH